MTVVVIRQAKDAEAEVIAEMWTRAANRLRDNGLDQWQYPVRVPYIRKNIAAGTCWMIESPDGTIIGTVTVDDYADPKLWQPADEPDRAYYVHRLVLDDGARGSELGSAVLDWAGARAHAAGKRWLRLDAWTSNPGLQRYYVDRGFRHVRTVEAPDIPSGAMFEREATVSLGRGPQIVQR